MANERTFLAWIRTSIAIMAFGFVVEKFSLFVRQLSYYLGKSGTLSPAGEIAGTLQTKGYSAAFGVMLVAFGTLTAVLAFIRYKKVEKQIDDDSYQPSRILDLMLALSLVMIGLFLVIYLIHSL